MISTVHQSCGLFRSFLTFRKTLATFYTLRYNKEKAEVLN